MNISQKDIYQKIIEKSGNELHFLFSDFLKQNQWEVRENQYYNDPFKKIPREIDIIATKKIPIKTRQRINDPLFYFL